MSRSRFPAPPPIPEATPIAEVDEKLAHVAANKDAWVDVPVAKRIEYLERCLKDCHDVAAAWARDGALRKGLDPEGVAAGEEWLAGPMTTLRNLRLLKEALEQGGQPKLPGVRRRLDGQVVVSVFPTDLKDKLMFGKLTAEVWIEKGKEPTQGAIYREGKHKPGKTCLVLGAGNVSSIPPMDVAYKLFVENEVCVLKMNPVNADAGPWLEKGLKSLIDDGFLAVVYGGADVGAHLAEHALVDTLHVTGSDRTYDAIVWGTDPEDVKRRKAAHERKNTRPFSSELGCVTPVMVVPGPWSEADMRYQARHVAGMVAQNASFNCNAAKVLVVAEGWDKRAQFLAMVREELAKSPARKAYYPGAETRYQGFLKNYPQAKVVGQTGDGVVPWTVIPDVKPEHGEYALTNEAFCGVLAEVSLPARTPVEFMERATKFANDDCWGTLSCTILVHDDTQRDHGGALERMIADLRYGGIGVNVWPGMIYGLCVTTWGAFPGHTPEDIQSGTGVVHNTFLLDHPEKSVVRSPFKVWPTLPYFADHKNLKDLAENLTDMETHPSWGRLVGVAIAAFQG